MYVPPFPFRLSFFQKRCGSSNKMKFVNPLTPYAEHKAKGEDILFRDLNPFQLFLLTTSGFYKGTTIIGKIGVFAPEEKPYLQNQPNKTLS